MMDWTRFSNPQKEGLLLYHGGHAPLRKIEDIGLFGGVFASGDPDVAASHGEYISMIEVHQVMRNFDLKHSADYETVAQIIRNETPAVTDDEVEIIFDSIVDNDDPSEEAMQVLGIDDWGEAGWELQRVRGAIARGLKYDAAEVSDEHGRSYLVLPGAKIR